MSNAQRVILNDEVGEVVADADLTAAYRVLDEAFYIQQTEQRPMTLQEALTIIAQIAHQIEALG